MDQQARYPQPPRGDRRAISLRCHVGPGRVNRSSEPARGNEKSPPPLAGRGVGGRGNQVDDARPLLTPRHKSGDTGWNGSHTAIDGHLNRRGCRTGAWSFEFAEPTPPQPPHERAGFALYAAAVAAARDPWFYGTLLVPDTLDGRFDLVALHAFLLVHRLQASPAPGPDLSQAVFDAMFSDMDNNLRELGVSDLRVGKRVGAMWEAFHGRSMAYAQPLDAADPVALAAALARNVWRGDAAGAHPNGLPRPCCRSPPTSRPSRLPICPPARCCSSPPGCRAMTPELHRPVAIERVGPAGLHVKVDASPEECAALARRMNLPAILAFSCAFHLEREPAGTLLAHGHLLAEVVQTCVISLDDFTATVEERFTVRCVPAGEETDDPDPEALDEIGYRGRHA